MGRKRGTEPKRRVTGKEDAIFLDDEYLDAADAEPLGYEEQSASFRSGNRRHVERKMTRRERKAIEKAEREAEKARKIQEAAEWKAEQKALRKEEKAAKREAARRKSRKNKTNAGKQSHSTGNVDAKRNATGKGAGKNQTAFAREERRKEKQISAQQSIPYREMAKDGICRVQDKYYSKSIRFYDINYQLAQNEDKNAIFENWCDFLNYFDSTIHFQFRLRFPDIVRFNSKRNIFGTDKPVIPFGKLIF